MMTGKSKAAGLLVLISLSALHGPAQAWRPDTDLVRRFENSLTSADFRKSYPAGEVPNLSDYARYYATVRHRGHRILVGELVQHDSVATPSGIYFVANEKNFPTIMDGGCTVVHVQYDVDAGKLLSLTCNLEA